MSLSSTFAFAILRRVRGDVDRSVRSRRHGDRRRDARAYAGRQSVNSRSGSVEQEGDTVIVTSIGGDSISREYYRVAGADSFVHSIDLSNDRGETWNSGSIEMTMTRAE